MKKTGYRVLFSELLVLSAIGIAHAHGNNAVWEGQDLGMQEMHESMTNGLSPDLKGQMDIMYENCMNFMMPRQMRGRM